MNRETTSFLPACIAAAVLGACSTSQPVAPPPLTPTPSAAAARPTATVDPISRGDARRAFESQPVAVAAARPIEPSARPSAMPMIDMTLPDEDPMEVAQQPDRNGPAAAAGRRGGSVGGSHACVSPESRAGRADGRCARGVRGRPG